ncbi:hypothetical protein K9N68_31685 [Kovacikia minuta CCNUW1]|nr:hypothetical protein [Kovacikia minuta]UBF26047.1 hypothetical protein K9N68_31685 [Kovacikia minuta CCNUW1]
MGWIDDQPYVVAVHVAGGNIDQTTGIGSENYAVSMARVEEWLKQQR